MGVMESGSEGVDLGVVHRWSARHRSRSSSAINIQRPGEVRRPVVLGPAATYQYRPLIPVKAPGGRSQGGSAGSNPVGLHHYAPSAMRWKSLSRTHVSVDHDPHHRVVKRAPTGPGSVALAGRSVG
jgi:hypothetical protein